MIIVRGALLIFLFLITLLNMNFTFNKLLTEHYYFKFYCCENLRYLKLSVHRGGFWAESQKDRYNMGDEIPTDLRMG